MLSDANGTRRLADKPGEIAITPDDRIIVETPGAGGYGDPSKRDLNAIAHDRNSGKFSSDFIAEHYQPDDGGGHRMAKACTSESAAIMTAQRYFDLSNRADLDAIEQLFTASSTYSSASTGVYLGAEDIMRMQRDFFAGFEHLHWAVHSREEIRPGVVQFDFTLTGTAIDGGEIIRHGIEYVIVHAGRVQHVEVRGKNDS